MAKKIGIVGTGYVGLVTGTCFAETGNDVYCVDIDEKKINNLKKGILPIFEPGLPRLVERNFNSGRLKFMTDLETAVRECEIIFLCLPTPPSEDGSADLHHVTECAADIAKILRDNKISDHKILVNKSTVPVGTSVKVHDIVAEYISDEQFDIVSNPEFLREGFAVEDSLKPERVVVGTSSEYVADFMRDIYEPFVRSGNPIIVMDEKSSELTKYASNSFLAVKISYMNDLSAYCEAIGADIEQIRAGMGADSRIGKRFLFAGIGYGGSCFPKDVRALMHSAEDVGLPLKIVTAAHEVNDQQRHRFINTILKRFDNNVKGMTFALWGLAFKPNTDDTREAPAFTIIEKLLEGGAKVKAYDPEAVENTKLRFGDKISYEKNHSLCLDGADALIIATEWTVFRKPDFDEIKSKLSKPIIFDGRNLFDLDEMQSNGFEYTCIGRKTIMPD